VALKSDAAAEKPKINFREIFWVVRFSTFATWGNSGIEPDKGKGISSPGAYEASLMWPRNDGERQWKYYVGLDVSLKQTSICVVDQTGSVVREGVVDFRSEAISVYVRSRAPDAVRIGLETGPTSTWLWTELKHLACR